MLRTALSALILAIGALSLPLSSGMAQDDRLRFEIVSPTDTTFNIVLGSVRWIKAGMSGIVVDPRQRDNLVARFTVVKLDERSARAVITGATTGITVYHTALLRAPRKPFFRQAFFWIGSGLGLAVGYLAGKG